MTGPLLGREPVMTVSTVVALLIAILPAFGWSTETVGTVAAALVLIGGAVEAALVAVDRLLPLLTGVAKAVLAVVASFGLHIPDNYVAALMAVLAVVGGLATRAQVSAVQPPRDRDGYEVSRRTGWRIGELDARPDLDGTDTPGMAPDTARLVTDDELAVIRGETEVFGAVAADGPVPESGDRYAEVQQREHRPRHGSPYIRLTGELGT
jgi:hypothetical protein